MSEFDRNFELYVACVHGNATKVKQLIKYGVHLNKRDSNGRTLLHDASVRNHIDIIRTLVQNGANEYVKDSRGRTPLMYASAKGHLEIVKYLIDRNTFRIPVLNGGGCTVMVETHEYLNTVDDDGRSSLMYGK
jgi:ankyrin repeat protein